MKEPVDETHSDRAAVILRQVAQATNLLIAGRTFCVRGVGQDAVALSALLASFGARLVPESADVPADFVICTGEGRVPVDLRSVRVASHRPTVVIDAGSKSPALDYSTAGETALARPGVLDTAVNPNLFLVPLGWRAASGHDSGADTAALRLDWARRFMPVAGELAQELAVGRSLTGLRIGVSMVLEPKTAVLALLLREAGAEVSVFAHADETDDAIADTLRGRGFPVDAKAGPDRADDASRARAFLDRDPQLILDDGSHIIRLAHEYRPERLAGVIAAAEETTSGLRPLRAMASAGELRVPVVAVNDARSKTLFDNAYGTAQSCVFAVLDLTGMSLSDANVVVAGFGPVGEGVARTVAALGARVTVAEVDPVRSLSAAFAGYRVARLADAVSDAALVISATGVENTISVYVLQACAPDAVIAVAGGVPQEIAIDLAIAAGATRTPLARKVETFTFTSGRSVRILDNGGCINITAGEGNPIEIMDLSFGVQLAAVKFALAEFRRDIDLAEAGGASRASVLRHESVHALPADADDHVAELALTAFGLDSDARNRRA